MKDLGNQIRNLRRRRGWTLNDLSRYSGLSIGFLSQIERGLSSLSISSLKAIAEALNVPLSRFFFVADNPSYVVKLHNRRKFQIEGSKVVYSSLSGPLEDKSLEPLIVELPPYYEGPPPFAHEGEEFVYVLEGTLSLIIQEKEYQLEPGDSVHFASVVPHTWKNNNSILSKVIWIGTPRMLGGDEHKL